MRNLDFFIITLFLFNLYFLVFFILFWLYLYAQWRSNFLSRLSVENGIKESNIINRNPIRFLGVLDNFVFGFLLLLFFSYLGIWGFFIYNPTIFMNWLVNIIRGLGLDTEFWVDFLDILIDFYEYGLIFVVFLYIFFIMFCRIILNLFNFLQVYNILM